MNFPEEKRPIDVTTKEKIYKDLPAKPKPPRRKGPKVPRHAPEPWDGFARAQAAWDRATTALLRGVGRGLRHPVAWLAIACLIGGLAYAHWRPPTVDGPALPRIGWRASASSGDDPQSAIDGDTGGGWTAGDSQAEWYAVDMRTPQTFHQVVLQSGPDDFPRDYSVYISPDGKHWGQPIAAGQGSGPTTIAAFPKVSARYVKVVDVKQARNADEEWSIDDFTVH